MVALCSATCSAILLAMGGWIDSIREAFRRQFKHLAQDGKFVPKAGSSERLLSNKGVNPSASPENDKPMTTALMVRTRPRLMPARKPVGLALQGGGSWGAYTWGVLDTLLAKK